MDTLAANLYTAIRDANEPRVMEMWHSSSMADCPRAHYMKRLGLAPVSEAGAGKMLRWQAGHLMEASIRPYLESLYGDLESNVRLDNKELDLTGEYDNYSEKAKTIFEIKSVHDFAFAYKKKGDSRFHLKDAKPYLNHELQNHCYVKLLRAEGRPVDYITYVYITLDGRIATYQTEVNPSILAEVDRRLEILNKAWATKTPPECICHQTDHPLYNCAMRWCQYSDGDKCCQIKEDK